MAINLQAPGITFAITGPWESTFADVDGAAYWSRQPPGFTSARYCLAP